MKATIIFALFFAAVSCVEFPLDVIEDESGAQFLMVPLRRERRQTTYDLSKGQNGLWSGSIGHQGTIAGNGNHALTGGAGASKTFASGQPLNVQGQLGYKYENFPHQITANANAGKSFYPNGPLSTGGSLDYNNMRTGTGIGVGASNTRGFGTDLGVEGKYNLWQGSKGGSIDAVGSYSKHFGGPFGNSDPQLYGGVRASIPFN